MSNPFWECWNLRSENGRQTWHFQLPAQLKDVVKEEADWQKPEAKAFLEQMESAFEFDKTINPNSADLVYRSKVDSESTVNSLPKIDSNDLVNQSQQSLLRGFEYYQKLQKQEGNWPSDYGGPMFLLPGLLIVSHLTKTPLQVVQQRLIARYMLNHQNEDGGWGLHIEGHSTMFGTVLQYVSLRLLGENPYSDGLVNARRWILEKGGATGVPPWGKFYLSLLGVYDWSGNDTLFPELWILPKSLPFHPSNYWCHARMVALGMTYCAGHKITAEENDLIRDIRTEIYPIPYEQIDWKSARKECNSIDEYQPLSNLYKVFIGVANVYENLPLKPIRKKALEFLGQYIDAEDIQTRFVNIGPVNQVINSLAVWHRHGKDSEQFKKHVARWQDYLWVAEDGIKMNGYNGSQLWDVAFASQALLESGMTSEFPQMAQRSYQFLDQNQIQHNQFEHTKFFREPSVGGWPFSTLDHGWPVTDCTAEGMKAALHLQQTGVIKDKEIIGLNRLKPTIDLLLKLQNETGGWASYEGTRGPFWLEKLNPSRIFNDIMVEYPYVECSSATMQGLQAFADTHPNYRCEEIAIAIKRGKEFILKEQWEDGSWYGSWGVCFTYGTWFGIEGLLAAGESHYEQKTPSAGIIKACEYLAGKQRQDGSWGESYRSCVELKYIEHKNGQIINTAWALLGLLSAKYPDKQVIEKGLAFLFSRQMSNGDWPQEGISGVFNKNCMETYTAYRNVFPLWAIGRFLKNQQYSKDYALISKLNTAHNSVLEEA